MPEPEDGWSGDNGNGSILYQQFGHLCGRVWTVHTGTLVDRKPVTLEFRRDIRGGHLRARAGNEALVFNVLRKAALRKPRALKVENRRRYSGRMRMMRAALDDGFLTLALFGG